ncbi:MAG: ATP-binding cassette domain-containing protein [Ignavibacteria bacterium]|nr:ATP-binding cassette domain-containing protein [Ignavibacteria bacterium]
MISNVLEVDTVTKAFERVKAVDQLSFRIERNEIFALLGPNGAGKTTTVRMLLGIIRPDSGFVRFRLNGQDVTSPLSSELGYLPEDRGLYKELPIEKTLIYMGVLRRMRRADAAKATSEWLERVGLKDRAKDKLETLSKGNQQKVQFISSILHKPAFVILDEPFSGLDPINQEFFLGVIRELRDSGTTVLLCAHQMNLVERLADRVLLMNRGREVLQGTVPHIKDQARSTQKVILTVQENIDISQFKDSSAVLDVQRQSDGALVFLLKKGESINGFLQSVSSKVAITAIHSEQISLHEVFVQSVQSDEGELLIENQK